MIPIIVASLAFFTTLVSVGLQIREQRKSKRISEEENERRVAYETDYKTRKDFLDSLVEELDRERKRNLELLNTIDALQKRHREALDKNDQLLGALARSERLVAALQFQIQKDGHS